MKIVTLGLILLVMASPVSAQDLDPDNDSLEVAGRAVVFFGPSQAEYLSMTHDEKDAIDEALYDFYHYRGKVLDFLEVNNIDEFSTAKRRIKVYLNGERVRIYDRRDFDHVVGLIMTNGQREPKVFLGPATDVEWIMMIEDYFGLY
jgi:hypothetical protein